MPPSSSSDSPLIRRIPQILSAAFVLGTAIASFRPVFSNTPWMLFLEDDFFYYLKIAQNLAGGHGSTFNGIVPTNGYHPLWLLLLTVACVISSAPKWILTFVATVTYLSSVSTYFLSRRLFVLSGLALLPASALAAYASLFVLQIIFSGMEIVLTIPLVLVVVLMVRRPALWQSSIHTTRDFALLGLLTSAMILSRLDTLLLAILMGAGLLSRQALRPKLLSRAALSGLSLGLSPVALYLLSNLLLFGTLLPISGMAKQMKTNYLPSAVPWLSTFNPPVTRHLDLIPIFAALLLLIRRWRRLSDTERALYPPILVFPFLYIALLSIRSDWQLWGWYYYPFVVAFIVALAVLCIVPVFSNPWGNRIAVALVLLLPLTHLHLIVWRTAGRESIFEPAQDLQAFSKTHPGTYAMGDRSGMAGWLLPFPVVQTEGLVMDKAFLASIRGRQPLFDVLASNHVRYYVASSEQPLSGCFHAVEPAQAGPASPHMRAELCQPPLATFHHRGWYNFVFEVPPVQPSH